MKIFTVATDDVGYLPALEESAEKQQVSLTVIGKGKKWGGFVWRYEQLQDHLAQLDPDEVAMVIDGYDTLILKSEAELMESFESLQTSLCSKKEDKEGFIVFASEHLKEDCSLGFYHTLVKASKHFFAVPQAPFVVNAGCYAGSARDLLKLCSFILSVSKTTGITDDQRILNTWFWNQTQDGCTAQDAESKLNVKVDFRGDLFYCAAERNLFYFAFSSLIDPANMGCRYRRYVELNDGSVVLSRSNKKIGVIHGICCTNMDAICACMDYGIPNSAKQQVGQKDLLIIIQALRLLVAFFIAAVATRSYQELFL